MSTRSGFGPGFAPAPGFHPATRSPAIYAIVSVTLWVLFFLSCTVTALSFLALLGHPCMLLVHRMRLSDRGARFGNIHFWLMFCRGVNILLIFAWLVQFAVNRQNAQANDYWLPLAWVLVHLALAGKLYVHIISFPRESGRSVHGEDSVEDSPPVPFLHDVPVLKVEQPCKAEDSPTATSHANNTYAIPISAFEMVMAAEGSWRPICKGEPFYRQSEYDACPPAASSTHATPSAAAAMLHPHIDGPLINIYYTVPERHAAAPPTQTAASCALVQKARCHDVSATPQQSLFESTSQSRPSEGAQPAN